MDSDDRDRLDRLDAGERRGFAIHALVYALVIPSLWALYFSSLAQGVHGEPPWPLWTMFGWGMGLMGHAFGMRKKVRRLQEQRDDALLAAPRPEIALPPEPDAADATLARAEALLQREKAR